MVIMSTGHPLFLTDTTWHANAIQERNFKDYMASYHRGWQVADLHQLVRTGRGRTDTVEHHLPTLTTNSGKLWSKVHVKMNAWYHLYNCFQSLKTLVEINRLWNTEVHRRFLTPEEMLTSHCIPTTGKRAKASGSPKLDTRGVETKALVKAAGNAMSVPCMGAFILACIMCLETIPWVVTIHRCKFMWQILLTVISCW